MREERLNRHDYQFYTQRRGRREMAAGTSNSRFRVTCGLLQRYIREHPRLESQLGGLAGAFQLSPQPLQATKRMETRAAQPLTIFYEGHVLMCEDFPPDKVNVLMKLLESASSPPMSRKVVVTGLSNLNLPMARKASLQRFLEKRRHRISAAYNPYKKATSGKHAATKKRVEDEAIASWLRL